MVGQKQETGSFLSFAMIAGRSEQIAYDEEVWNGENNDRLEAESCLFYRSCKSRNMRKKGGRRFD